MSNCPVCNSLIVEASNFCQSCSWPLGSINISNAGLKKAIEAWAKKNYGDVLNSKRNSGLPVSGINVQLGDSQSLELLRPELSELNNKIRSNEYQQEKSNIEISSLLDKSKKVDEEIQSINISIQRISSFLKDQNLANKQVDNQIQSNENNLRSYDLKIQGLLKEQQKQLGEIDMLKSILGNRRVSSAVVVTPIAKEQSSASPSSNVDLSFSPEELDLVGEYNRYLQEVPNSLRDRATNVSIDDETFARLRDGNDSIINFKTDRKGNYLIISRGGYRYLVPNKQRRIISQIYTTTKAIYNCDGYGEDYQSFKLIKPALVLEESIDVWKLSQKGILEFI
jgi:hypothetical protein